MQASPVKCLSGQFAPLETRFNRVAENHGPTLFISRFCQVFFPILILLWRIESDFPGVMVFW